MTLDIPALRKMLSEATPGPWERESLPQRDAPDKHDEFAVVDPGGRVICDTQNADWTLGEIHTEGPDEDGFVDRWNEPSRRNIEFIAALRNLAPALLSEAASAADLRREVAQLREALERIRDLTPYAANTVSADGHHSATKAIAATALDDAALAPQEPNTCTP